MNGSFVAGISHSIDHSVEGRIKFKGFFKVDNDCFEGFAEFFFGAKLVDYSGVYASVVSSGLGFANP